MAFDADPRWLDDFWPEDPWPVDASSGAEPPYDDPAPPVHPATFRDAPDRSISDATI